MNKFKIIQFVILIVAVLWIINFVFIFFLVPSDIQQGVAQRILYFHVPTAWVSFICFSISFYYSIVFLKTKNIHNDIIAYSYTLLGWFFTTGVLITGPLWAKPIWGHFWNWSDQRLVSFFIMWITYTSYLLFRLNIQEIYRRGNISAVINILAFINIPIVYLSIRIWDTPSHPGPVVGGEAGSGMTTEMRFVFWFSIISFLFLMYILSNIVKRVHLLEYHFHKKR